MGIPSYFSHIVKNHSEIIKRLDKLKSINNIYLDSNSIIYDTLRIISKEYTGNDDKFEDLLIQGVIDKLDEYLHFIKPTGVVFIAFDGVAPVAKLEQQRTRRYKSYLLNDIRSKLDPTTDKVWDKTAITPGTNFMKKLGEGITGHYINKEKSYGANQIIVSTSQEPGEGEHKIFQYIRDRPKYHEKTNTLVYGLDADLIMLCLNHLPISKHIYLYRETPEFIKSINSDLEPNEAYFLDIPELANVILQDMNGYGKIDSKEKYNRLYDYIFLCFFLGNDFLPHFPSVNIRTGGINILTAAYRNTIGKTNKNLTNGKTIFWNNVYILVEYLANHELENLKSEYKIRNKWEKRFYPSTDIDEQMKKLDAIPTKRRSVEKFIDPHSHHWENRYYKKLFNMDLNRPFLQEICNNYMEGLEWVMNYYTTGCLDWRWSYKYHYPPLWKHLLQFIPRWNTVMIPKNDHKNVSQLVQLSYVLPRPSLKLLPSEIEKVLLEKYKSNYPLDCEMHWAFCKYFWEAHPGLPHINIANLENLCSTN